MAGLKRSLVTEPTKHVAAPTIAAVAQKNQSSSRSNHPKTCSANIIALAASAPSAVHTERRHRTDVDGTSKYNGTSTRTHTGRMKNHIKMPNAIGVFQSAATTVPSLRCAAGNVTNP